MIIIVCKLLVLHLDLNAYKCMSDKNNLFLITTTYLKIKMYLICKIIREENRFKSKNTY